MKLIEPSVAMISGVSQDEALWIIANAARECYQSSGDNDKKLVRNCIKRQHFSVLEHVSCTFHITCDRGVSHELVRHRLASYNQESTRYCNYSKGKFDSEITFVKPWWYADGADDNLQKAVIKFDNACKWAEETYMQIIELGLSPQAARAVLPNAVKTGVVMTANLREWRHFINLRYFGTTGEPHPDMKIIAGAIYDALNSTYPIFFEDMEAESE